MRNINLGRANVKHLYHRKLNFYKQSWNIRHSNKRKCTSPYNNIQQNQGKSIMKMSKSSIISSEDLYEMSHSQQSEDSDICDCEANSFVMAGTGHLENTLTMMGESDSDFYSSDELLCELPSVESQMERLSIRNISPIVYSRLTGATNTTQALYARLSDLLQEPDLYSIVTLQWNRYPGTLYIQGFPAVVDKVHRCLVNAVQVIRRQMREGATSYSYPLSTSQDGSSLQSDMMINIQAGGRFLSPIIIDREAGR